ncbi:MULTISPECIES: NUDIX hydrolase [unclassified Lentilitoribacter]|jgi:8-oxo-dGTP pyrophosphatase MutT (NUDIX family)|uniref:NUDIX hydrolase n=1 Tax=unclassified Lentilitoribacter TaxID=2647570 RepID=UPI0018D8BAB9|nr:NUDIX domain-containing protein [Lentilitoribacter sp. Alg239-R112]
MHRVGVLPFDIFENEMAMLFITSKTRGRWIPPKGRAKDGESHEDVCHREAFEEAGINGTVLSDFPITVVISRTKNGVIEKIPVTYYPFLVESQSNAWPEKDERERHWVTMKDVQRFADRKDFYNLLAQFEELTPWIKTAALLHKSEQPKAQKQAQ